MDNNMNEQKEITEITMFEKVYKVADCTQRVLSTFSTVKRMEQDAAESNYKAVKDNSAVAFQKEQLQKLIEEDKLKAVEEEPEE
jgi:hypothetical protein